jgi:hypothetical protein
MKTLLSRILLLTCAIAAAGLVGCASDDEIESRSERPWNTPKGWESGLPTGLTEGR